MESPNLSKGTREPVAGLTLDCLRSNYLALFRAMLHFYSRSFDMGVWLAVGVGAGAVFGILFNNIALGAAFGAAVGAALGAAMDSNNKRKP